MAYLLTELEKDCAFVRDYRRRLHIGDRLTSILEDEIEDGDRVRARERLAQLCERYGEALVREIAKQLDVTHG